MNRVALVGKAHSGKTTTAKALVEQGYQRVAFADPVKEITAKMLTVFEQHVLFPEGIQYVDPLHIPKVSVEEVEQQKGHPAIRKLLQLVGTDIGREWFGPETIWIDVFQERVKNMIGPLVIDDCRFPDEALALKELGFTIVKLVRDEQERIDSIIAALLSQGIAEDDVDEKLEQILSHPSETMVDKITPDVSIHSVSVDQLQTIVASELYHLSPEDFIYRYTKEPLYA